MPSTLLMKLIANDDAPFPQEFQDNNRKILMMHFAYLKQGTNNFDSVAFVTSALNYLSSYNKAKLIDTDLGEEHAKAATAILNMVRTKPYKLTPEGAKDVETALEYWLDIVSQSSAKLVREIQHHTDTLSTNAKKVKERQKMRKNAKRK